MATDMGFEPVESGPYYFISYDSLDMDTVSQYLLRLKKDGLPMWYDKGIHSGDKWESVITKHIRGCEAVLLFMSKSPFTKDNSYVRKEFNTAQRREKPIYVIYIDDVKDADVTEEYDMWWDELCKIQGILAHRIGIEETAHKVFDALCYTPGSMSPYTDTTAEGDTPPTTSTRRPRAPRSTAANSEYSPLQPTGYRYYLGGLPFSDDPAILSSVSGGIRAKKLREALKEIFYHWNTDQAFANPDGSALKDDFKNLIRVACRDTGVDGGKINEILSHNVDTDPVRNKNCKFFRLFYEVIFQGKDRPKEFYWSNSLSLARLTPLFRDVGDFSDKFCEDSAAGDNVRKIFHTHTKEICSFLEIENSSQLLDSIMINTAERRGEVVWLDSSGSAPVNLGSVNDFIKKMAVISDAKSMKSMINFLRDFSFTPVSQGSDHYVLAPRIGDSFLSEIYEDSIKNDDELFDILDIKENARTIFANHLTLLREYVKITSSDRISVKTKFGPLNFNTTNLASDVKTTAKEYCEIAFGDEVPDGLKNAEIPKRLGFLKLAQLLEKHKVLRFGQSAEPVTAYLELVDGGADAAANYLRLFGYDQATIFYGNQSVTVSEYITKKISQLNPDNAEKFFEGNLIVASYLNKNPSASAASDKSFGEMMSAARRSFEEFTEYVYTIPRGIAEDKKEVYDGITEEPEPQEAAPVAQVPDSQPAEENSEEISSAEPAAEAQTAPESVSDALGQLASALSSALSAAEAAPETPAPTSAPAPKAPEPAPEPAPAPAEEPQAQSSRRARRKTGGTAVDKDAEQRLSELLGL